MFRSRWRFYCWDAFTRSWLCVTETKEKRVNVARAKLTTKKLAQRIDLEYFKRPHPFRRLRFILSVSVPLAALLWLGWYALLRGNQVYRGGRGSAPPRWRSPPR